MNGPNIDSHHPHCRIETNSGTGPRMFDSSGVTLVEFALVFPWFLLFAMVILDFGRASALRGVLDEAVNRSLARAITVGNLDIDPTGLTQADDNFERLHLARQKVAGEGMNFLNGVRLLHTANDASLSGAKGARVYDIQFTENRIADGPVTDTLKLMVLLPGECATLPTLSVTECNRQTLGTSPADPAPELTAELLMERHPIRVVAYATFDSYTPFLFRSPIRVEAYGYRQPIPQGPFAAAEDPGLVGGNGNIIPPTQPPLVGSPVLPTEPIPVCKVGWGANVEASKIPILPIVPAILLPNGPSGICVNSNLPP